MSELEIFRKKHSVVRACRWFKNGDHPNDGVGLPRLDEAALINAHPELIGPSGRSDVPITDEMRAKFSYPGIEGNVVRFFRRPEPHYAGDKHHSCSYTWNEHGWIENNEQGLTVCPGDWIITEDSGLTYPVSPNTFKISYDRMPYVAKA